MTWFSLPGTQPENKAAFCDSTTATAWLAQQPQANAAAMQAELARQLQALNTYRMAALERFKTLEALRRTLFVIDGEAQRRFENRPIPLTPSEQSALDTSRRLWRICAVAYLHCLRACLDGDPGVAELKAKIAHRVLVCLRMEQFICYLGRLDLEPDFWLTLHSILASAEQLGVLRDPVADRLLGETSESTVSGQYAMTLLLHLARPFELSRNQLAAAIRWFARWREQSDITSTASEHPKSRNIALDLSFNRPILAPGGTPGIPRWLAIDGILRKMRKRLESLEAGESPENLNLGSGMSSAACSALLKTLTRNLRSPLQLTAAILPETPLANVAVGLENIYQQIAGKKMQHAEEPSSINRREQAQIEIFGHIAHASEEQKVTKPETWFMPAAGPALLASEGSSGVQLCRPAGKGETRLNHKCLFALQLPGRPRFSLASAASLCMRSDGSLHAVARLLPGEPLARVAEIGERLAGKVSLQPAFLLPAIESLGSPPSVILPAGVPARALSIRLHSKPAQAITLSSCIERGGDYERWTYEAS